MDLTSMEFGARLERALAVLDRNELDRMGRQTLSSLRNIFSAVPQVETLPPGQKKSRVPGLNEAALAFHQADDLIEEVIRLLRKILDWLKRELNPTGFLHLLSQNSSTFLPGLSMRDIPRFDWDIMEQAGVQTKTLEKFFSDGLDAAPALFKTLNAEGISVTSWLVSRAEQTIEELEALRSDRNFVAGTAARQQQSGAQQGSWWDTVWRGVQISAGAGVVVINAGAAYFSAGMSGAQSATSACIGIGMVAGGARS